MSIKQVGDYAEFEIYQDFGCGDGNEYCAGTSGPREEAQIAAMNYAEYYSRDDVVVRVYEIHRHLFLELNGEE